MANAISPWSESPFKRMLDLSIASVLALLFAPISLVIAILVKASSPGGVFFLQPRVTLEGRTFNIVKFRTMVERKQDHGPELTCSGDSRVTAAGRLLRKWKLDELPQLWNVIKGDMSLVGPRPEVPRYLSVLRQRPELFRLRPGITSNASLQFVNEEEVLASAPDGDLEHFYIATVLPSKMQIDLEYAKQATCLTDLKLLLRTATRVIHRGPPSPALNCQDQPQ